MPKRKPSQPQGDVHVEVEPRTNNGKRKKDRATMDVPQTSNLVPVEHAEEIPVFAVLAKKDKSDLSQEGFEKKKKEIAESISIDADKILICENYQPKQKPDSRDVEILEFLTKSTKKTPICTAAQLRLSINSVQTKSTGNVHYDITVYYKPRKIPCKGYWNPSNEEDRTLNLPNFIDIIGFDVQLSNPEKVGTVNSQMINLIINGALPENCDLLDLGKKLKEEMEIENNPEVESLAIDIIVVVISLKDDNIPHALLKEIYIEANFRTRSNLLIDESGPLQTIFSSTSGENVKVVLAIPVIANPPPQALDITWMGPTDHPITPTVSQRDVVYKHWVNTSVPIKNHSNFGYYVMKYKNEIIHNITINAQDRPEQPLNFMAYSYASGYVNMTWTSGFNGGSEQFFILWMSDDTDWKIIANLTDPGKGGTVHFYHGPLTPGNHFSFNKMYPYVMPRLNENQCNRALGMMQAGMAQHTVARHFGVHRNTIQSL
uniref:Uncharacterized protein n=1 Tax=Magallana gigas TaxID=29159 RepID=K1RJI2_MAGGI